MPAENAQEIKPSAPAAPAGNSLLTTNADPFTREDIEHRDGKVKSEAPTADLEDDAVDAAQVDDEPKGEAEPADEPAAEPKPEAAEDRDELVKLAKEMLRPKTTAPKAGESGLTPEQVAKYVGENVGAIEAEFKAEYGDDRGAAMTKALQDTLAKIITPALQDVETIRKTEEVRRIHNTISRAVAGMDDEAKAMYGVDVATATEAQIDAREETRTVAVGILNLWISQGKPQDTDEAWRRAHAIVKAANADTDETPKPKSKNDSLAERARARHNSRTIAPTHQKPEDDEVASEGLSLREQTIAALKRQRRRMG